MSLESFIINKTWKKNDARRDAGLVFPQEIESVRDIPYGGITETTLDLYYPKSDATGSNSDSAESKLNASGFPVIVNVHGGGYVYGSKELYQYYCADLARRGFAVVNYDYRLAPKYKFPTPLIDLSHVFAWLETSGSAYPLDLANVFLVGDSAGAQIASQYAVICTNEEYHRLFDGYLSDKLSDTSDDTSGDAKKITIKGLSLACGIYDLENHVVKSKASKNGTAKKPSGIVRDYLTSYPEQFGEMLKVTDYINENYPECYIFSSGGDFLKDNVEPMVTLLKEKGVSCESRIYGDESTHHVFHLDIRSDLARQANDDQAAFLHRLTEH